MVTGTGTDGMLSISAMAVMRITISMNARRSGSHWFELMNLSI